jgi:hypothetical protein
MKFFDLYFIHFSKINFHSLLDMLRRVLSDFVPSFMSTINYYKRQLRIIS